MDEVGTGPKPANSGPLEEPHPPGSDFANPPPWQEPTNPLFFGPHGLRPGWRLLLYLLMWRALRMVLGALLEKMDSHLEVKLWLDLMAESGSFAAVAIPAVVMGWVEKRPFGDYGLPGRGAFGKSFWLGVGWGAAAISLLMLAIGGAGDFSLGTVALHGPRLLKMAVFWGAFFLAVGFFEEFLLRGYTQFTLTLTIGFWPSAVLLSAIFAGLHYFNRGESWVGLLAVGAIGLFLCLTLRRTGNLWFAVGFHASWDWAESFLYSVPDSGGMVTGHLLRSSLHGSRWLTGGSVGPEGSLLFFVVIALTWVAFDRMYREVKNDFRPRSGGGRITSGA